MSESSSVSQTVSKSVNQNVSQSVGVSGIKTVNQLVKQSFISRSDFQLLVNHNSKKVSQSVSQFFRQTVSHSVRLSDIKTVSQFMGQSVRKSIHQTVSYQSFNKSSVSQ